eukprot:3649644-Prorocentrum_lima.AAC.1
MAQKAHLEARQRVDIRRDLASRLLPSDVWYWDKDTPKLRSGQWRRARVLSVARAPMITIEMDGRAVR